MMNQNNLQEKDIIFMRHAIELAKCGLGWTNPNPLVGAVLVKDGTIIGEGFHHRYGDLHAEREALADCLKRGFSPAGATAYVTLEPCAHFGKQPPCSHALVEAGVSKVFVGSRDPNPLVHGKGNSYLREHGIQVKEDFLRSECDALNPIFFHFITTGTPYIALKYAMTLDGKIATKTDASKWITGEKSRQYVQTLRNRYNAILAGIGTVLADDPLLTCRIPGGHNPTRIICDDNLSIPLNSNLVKTAREVPLIIAALDTPQNHDNLKVQELIKLGAQILFLPQDSSQDKENPHLSLKELFIQLGKNKIDSILIEGGGQINYSALQTGMVNHIYAFIAPKIFGGTAKSPVAGTGLETPDQAFMFNLVSTEKIDQDILLQYDKINN